MSEIPNGEHCDCCPWLSKTRRIRMNSDFCGCPAFELDEGAWHLKVSHFRAMRSPACLSAYPNGAVITIAAKPSVAIGFIPKEQTVDPKTGATTFTDIELLEVSEIKPK